MSFSSADVPRLIHAPWGYSGFMGGCAHTCLKSSDSPVTLYLENTGSQAVVVGLSLLGSGSFKVELYDDVTFTGSTVVDGINSARNYSTADVNSPLKVYSAATGESLGSPIWTWHSESGKTFEIFGNRSMTGASLVLAGNTKSAIKLTDASGGSLVDMKLPSPDLGSPTSYWGGGVGVALANETLDSKSAISLDTNSGAASRYVYPVKDNTGSTWPGLTSGKKYRIKYNMWAEYISGWWGSIQATARLRRHDNTADTHNSESWSGQQTYTADYNTATSTWGGMYLDQVNWNVSYPVKAAFTELELYEVGSVKKTINLSVSLWDGSKLGDV